MSLVAAYIVPHPPLAIPEVGRGEERKIESTIKAYHEVSRRIAGHEPETIVFISPHSAFYRDWIYVGAGSNAQGTLAGFGAPQVGFSIDYSAETRAAIIEEAHVQEIPAGYVSDEVQELDHGLLVPLYFIHETYPTDRFTAVSLGGSGLDRAVLIEFGRCLSRAMQQTDAKMVLVASGDLSHKLKPDGPYGFNPAGPRFDKEFAQIVEAGDPMGFSMIDSQVSEDAAECGLSGFIMLAGALDEASRLQAVDYSSELLSLEGPFGVGYGVAAFEQI